MEFNARTIIARDIPDAWFQAVDELFKYGFEYIIEHGSFKGETRFEFDQITIIINYPYAEPYDQMLPEIPAHFNIPNPVANGYVEQYLPYLMTDAIEEGEQYSYGNRMNKFFNIHSAIGKPEYESQILYWIKVLKETPNTNQAILQVAQPDDCLLGDPPCLRHIDMRIKDNTLIFYPYFRSWDLWSGFPANLAGIAVLQKYMADSIGVKSGLICASSKGLHIYKYVEELAKIRTGRS